MCSEDTGEESCLSNVTVIPHCAFIAFTIPSATWNNIATTRQGRTETEERCPAIIAGDGLHK